MAFLVHFYRIFCYINHGIIFIFYYGIFTEILTVFFSFLVNNVSLFALGSKFRKSVGEIVLSNENPQKESSLINPQEKKLSIDKKSKVFKDDFAFLPIEREIMML